MSNIKKIVLVDGSSYLFRAFYALPELSNKQGEPTGLIFGIINMLKRLPHQLSTDYIAVIFDAKGKNFRHDLYPEYKAHRKVIPKEMEIQIPIVHEVIKKLGFPVIVVDGVEADDVIGTLAVSFSQDQHEVVVLTSDKDMAQLVNARITLMDTMKNEISDRNRIIEKFGVTPEQIVDYLSLIGDVSDNIPGIPKVGPKTAIKWLKKYHSVREIILNADNFTGKVGENLRKNIKILPISYQLATIKCNLQLPYNVEDMHCTNPDFNYLREFFKRYGFKPWLRDLEKKLYNEEKISQKGKLISDCNYQVILSKNLFDIACQKLERSQIVACSIKTDSLNFMYARLIGISFAIKPYHGFYIPLQHNYPTVPYQLPTSYVLNKLKGFLENENIVKIVQNVKFSIQVLTNLGINIKGIKYDITLESYVLHSTATKHDLDSLAEYYLKIKRKSNILNEKNKLLLKFGSVDIDEGGLYASEEVDIIFRLHECIWEKLQKIKSLYRLYIEEEFPVSFAIGRMEYIGVKIDTALLHKQNKFLTKKILEIEEQCIKISGEKFNISSPKQLRRILYEKMKLPILGKTATGEYSTSEDVLQKLSANYKLPKLIIEHRHLMKLKTTYIDKLPLMINNETMRIHTSYQQAVTSTGRLSSINPNLQNIPIKSNIGKNIRKAFVAERGYKIVTADYSQIELRIMAHLSNDHNLIRDFRLGQDIHSSTAAEIFGVKLDKVNNTKRRQAKVVNFGLIYGMSAFGLAKKLEISRQEAKDYINSYFSKYPSVKSYMENIKFFAMENGFVETIFGRRLYLANINSCNTLKKHAAERLAINAPMQGSAADIIKYAMIAIDKWIINEKIDAKMLMQVHDELVFEIKEDLVIQVSKEIKKFMESSAFLKVPLIVDLLIGDNWGME